MNYRTTWNNNRLIKISSDQLFLGEIEMKKITPFLWFDTQAEEAMNFYVSLFKNSKVNNISRGPDGKAFIVSFELDG